MEVTPARTAAVVGSGSVDVLATPELVTLIERTAVSLVSNALPEGHTTVGTRVELDHVAPTPVGSEVTATVRLDSVEGRTLRFSFEVNDPAGVVARGSHVRAIVDVTTFDRRAAARRGEPVS
jgi:predicted thioesterase